MSVGRNECVGIKCHLNSNVPRQCIHYVTIHIVAMYEPEHTSCSTISEIRFLKFSEPRSYSLSINTFSLSPVLILIIQPVMLTVAMMILTRHTHIFWSVVKLVNCFYQYSDQTYNLLYPFR